MQTIEPERQLVRKVTPFAPVALILALVAGLAFGGSGTGASAAIGILVVFGNLVANAWVVSSAARISVTALFAAVMGGFIIRMAVILAMMFWLNTFSFFSPVAFALAVVPATILLIAYEMKLIAGPLGQQWKIPQGPVTR